MKLWIYVAQLNFIESNISLKEKSYYKMGGVARYFALPKNLPEIAQTIAFAKTHALPIAILGSGSNCVFSDEYFDGIVIALEKLSAWWWETDDILFAECGVTNTEIAEICLEQERKDASWMYRMPGQIGASVRMNARCYGGEMSKIVKEILTIDPNGHFNYHNAKKILIGYKNTLLMNKPEIVVGVRFCFPNIGTHEEILSHMKACETDRHTKQHFLFPSCGSTFKNNYEYGKPSGRIFDELGLKGTQKGDAEVSAYHGNFVWNKKLAKTNDMLNLAAFMRMQAQERLAVELNLEVQPIGSFERDVFEACGMKNAGPYVQNGDKYLTGLFYNPDLTAGSKSFPTTVFSSFFMNYFHKKNSNLPQIYVEILQLQSLETAQQNSRTPFLRWTTICDENYKEYFHFIPKSMEDCKKLWEFSVSEIFLAHPTQSRYLECEMTPYGHLLTLQFEKCAQAGSPAQAM